jgi:hypothetical protein
LQVWFQSNLTELEIFLEIDVFVCLNLKNMNVNAIKDQQPVFASESFSFVLVSKFLVNKNFSNIVGQWKPVGV